MKEQRTNHNFMTTILTESEAHVKDFPFTEFSHQGRILKEGLNALRIEDKRILFVHEL